MYFIDYFELSEDFITEQTLLNIIKKDLKFSYKKGSKRPIVVNSERVQQEKLRFLS